MHPSCRNKPILYIPPVIIMGKLLRRHGSPLLFVNKVLVPPLLQKFCRSFWTVIAAGIRLETYTCSLPEMIQQNPPNLWANFRTGTLSKQASTQRGLIVKGVVLVKEAAQVFLCHRVASVRAGHWTNRSSLGDVRTEHRQQLQHTV